MTRMEKLRQENWVGLPIKRKLEGKPTNKLYTHRYDGVLLDDNYTSSYRKSTRG